jgi:hypothetical protein
MSDNFAALLGCVNHVDPSISYQGTLSRFQVVIRIDEKRLVKGCFPNLVIANSGDQFVPACWV